ncbi:MAG TPA: DUF4065 domain-containing protein [Syntrophales bacterium]|nr:DUF4065 domain-containing protein [Syntrophales bacterium]
MVSCRDVAKYFLTLNDPEIGDLISNLKLQKLVYYAQGFHLAIEDEPLFSDSIEAWAHGPVIPALYHDYKCFADGPIPPPDYFDVSNLSEDVRSLLDDVYSVFGQFSAWKLRNMTHEEPPWIEAWKGDKIISKKSMRYYFKTLLVNE